MGKYDVILSQYFEDHYRYADLINGFLFDGEQIVKETDVTDGNPVMTNSSESCAGGTGKRGDCPPVSIWAASRRTTG